MKASEITALLAVMKAAWPWAKLEDDTVAVYRDAWASLPTGEAAQALKECVREMDRPPSVAELIRRVEFKQRRQLAAASTIPQLPPAQRMGSVEAREAIQEVLKKWGWK